MHIYTLAAEGLRHKRDEAPAAQLAPVTYRRSAGSRNAASISGCPPIGGRRSPFTRQSAGCHMATSARCELESVLSPIGPALDSRRAADRQLSHAANLGGVLHRSAIHSIVGEVPIEFGRRTFRQSALPSTLGELPTGNSARCEFVKCTFANRRIWRVYILQSASMENVLSPIGASGAGV